MARSIATNVGVPYTAMLGLGVHRPTRIVPNEEIARNIDSTPEWIQARSGIVGRRFAAAEESVVSMSVIAGRAALESAGVVAEQIDTVIVATSTYLLLTPPAAPQVATQLGITDGAAFDVSAGCAGFCHALTVASDLIRGGTSRQVLVVGVEKLTDTVDPNDRATAFLFGDGAGAVVVGPADTAGIGPTVWGSDGGRWTAIRQNKDWIEFFAEIEDKGPDAVRPYLTMDGTAVFRWAAHSLEKVCLEALDCAGVTVDDLDVMVPHQANGRIVEIMARVLKLPEHCGLANDIETMGNTSAASIPLAMDRVLREHQAAAGDTALLVGFGAGLTYASQVVKLPPNTPAR